RAALLAALVCATSPMYFFVARQAITDMPYIGPMTAGICLAAVALLDEDVAIDRRSPWWWSLVALWLLVTVPQLVYDSIALRLAAPAQAARAGRHRLRRGGRISLVPRDADSPRPAVLERAHRRQSLAASGHRPARRQLRRHRLLPARAGLRAAAVDGGRGGGD